MHGKCKTWLEDGIVKVENYKNGVLHGNCTEWLKNGRKNVQCNYKDGKLHGKYIEWDINGEEKIDESIFRNGKIIN